MYQCEKGISCLGKISLAHLTQFGYKFDFVTEEFNFTFVENEGQFFQCKETPIIFDFQLNSELAHEEFHRIDYKSDNNHNRNSTLSVLKFSSV